jgi:hypothetical protein
MSFFADPLVPAKAGTQPLMNLQHFDPDSLSRECAEEGYFGRITMKALRWHSATMVPSCLKAL